MGTKSNIPPRKKGVARGMLVYNILKSKTL